MLRLPSFATPASLVLVPLLFALVPRLAAEPPLAISATRMLDRTRISASDESEGRAPATRPEWKTDTEFKARRDAMLQGGK